MDILGTLPNRIGVACSGGPDSMAALDFVLNTRREVSVFTFDHNTGLHEKAVETITKYLAKKSRKDVEVVSSPPLEVTKPKKVSKEEHWRDHRYTWLDYCANKYNLEIITAHNLDDCIETWLWGAMHGNPRTIPYRRNRVIRPFLLWKKEELKSWCHRQKIEYLDDPSNLDKAYMRGIMRTEVVPSALKIHPGLHTSIRNVVLESVKVENSSDKE